MYPIFFLQVAGNIFGLIPIHHVLAFQSRYNRGQSPHNGNKHNLEYNIKSTESLISVWQEVTFSGTFQDE